MPLWYWLILFAAYGACVGSFLNVVIYRLPAGENLVSPPSACPYCAHKLAWYDNVPIFAWLWLRGRCRYCRVPISVQYPVIEGITATLFGGIFSLYYMTDLWPLWGHYGFHGTWPLFLIHLVLIASLIPATMIDGKFFIIPLSIPRVATMVAVAGLPLTVLAFPDVSSLRPQIGTWEVGAALGGVLGLVIANSLVAIGILPISFIHVEESGEEEAELTTEDQVVACGLAPVEPPDSEPGSGASVTEADGEKAPIEQTGADEARSTVKANAETKPQAASSDEADWSPWRGMSREILFAAGLVLAGVGIYLFQTIGGDDRAVPADPMRLNRVAILTVVGSLLLGLVLFGLIWMWWRPHAQVESDSASIEDQRPTAEPSKTAGSSEPLTALETPQSAEPQAYQEFPPPPHTPESSRRGEASSEPQSIEQHPESGQPPAVASDQAEQQPPSPESSPEQWLAHPSPRREIIKECLFLFWPAVGTVLGVVLLSEPAAGFSPPVVMLASSVCGYMGGGALIWLARVLGTLGFGKEAMGLGDVHLMGAIGAVLGWVDSIVVFFMAPFFGILAALVMAILGRLLRGQVRMIPYGPYLAIAAVIVMVFGHKRIFGIFGILTLGQG